MRITISGKENIDEFIYLYLPAYIYKLFLSQVNLRKLSRFDKEYNINSFNILKYSLNNLLITKTSKDEYNIKINNSLKINNKSIGYYINLITYGTRTIKGYTILLDIFNTITNNINLIYKEWEDGY